MGLSNPYQTWEFIPTKEVHKEEPVIGSGGKLFTKTVYAIRSV